jgi:hypothetical protein
VNAPGSHGRRGRGAAELALVREHRGQPVPAHRRRAAGARRGGQRRPRRQAGGRAVLADRDHRAVGVDGEVGHRAGLGVLLRALDQPDVGEPRQRLGA